MSAFKKQVAGKHYLNFAIQPMEFFIKNNISKIDGDIIQYTLREKGDPIENIDKAIHCLELKREAIKNGSK
tara:strand:+ start:277 stop:489 length:213 start_codon:yes stop_codon:yes gene_type:complete